MRKLIITVAQTGGIHSKEKNPNLPEQPEEIVKSAYECYNEGAAIVHIHARDKAGNITTNPQIYKEIHESIRSKCNIILQDTTGGGPGLTLDQRFRILEAMPEMASLNMGTMLRTIGPRAGDIVMNPRTEIERFAKEMLDRSIKPEMEVYSHSMFREVHNLIQKSLVKKPYYVNLVLGMSHQGAVEATPEYLWSLREFLPQDTIFNVCAIGKAQLPLTTMSMLLGGVVRVGMEDNIYYKKGVLAESNVQLLARTVRIARELELEIASPDEAREILGIKVMTSH
jgi:3-keto-5-aminohexanoate cleavage enzyme